MALQSPERQRRVGRPGACASGSETRNTDASTADWQGRSTGHEAAGWALPTARLVLGAQLTLLLAGCPLPADWAASRFDLQFNVGDVPTPIGVTAAPVFQSEPVFEEIAGKAGSHAPTITAFPDGELLAAWYSYDGPGELDGAHIYAARRLPGQVAWDAPTPLVDRALAVGNPVLYSAADEVWLFYAVVPAGWSTAHIEVQRSADRGRTWSAPRTLDGPLGSNVRSPPVRLHDTTLLLPAYDDLIRSSLFFASADGETWTLRSIVATPPPYQNLQPSVAPASDGRLLAVMRNSGRGWLWVTASTDGGRTWAAAADAGFPNPASPAALLSLASGNLVLVYNDSNSDRRPLSITISADDARTWHPPRVLVDGAGAYAYPAAVQTPDGLIHVVYSHNRRHIQHLALSAAWVVAPGS